jgi:hypothetical protein
MKSILMSMLTAAILGALVAIVILPAAANGAVVQAYLPLVSKAALPPPEPGAEIVNPGFEQGETGWKFTVDLGNPVLSTAFAHGGLNSAELGLDFVNYPLDNQRTASIEQLIYVRTGQTALEYWEYVNSQEEPDPDTGQCPQFNGDHVRIYINTVQVVDASLCMPENSIPAWVLRTVDLSAYPEQWVNFKMVFQGDSTLPTDYFVDDFIFVAP